jgi:hypothetical protein
VVLGPSRKEECSISNKKPPVDRAVATIKRSTRTDAEKVTVTSDISQAMQTSPDYVASAALQTAVKAWSAEATSIGTQVSVVAGLRAQLKTAVAKLASLRCDWQVAKMQVTSIATSVCAGSPDRVKALNLDVIVHARIGALAAPIGFTGTPGTGNGQVELAWTKGNASHGWLVQYATDPSNATTVSASIPSTKRKITLSGLPHSANLSFRVAAIDPTSATGMSPWSAWITATVR